MRKKLGVIGLYLVSSLLLLTACVPSLQEKLAVPTVSVERIQESTALLKANVHFPAYMVESYKQRWGFTAQRIVPLDIVRLTLKNYSTGLQRRQDVTPTGESVTVTFDSLPEGAYVVYAEAIRKHNGSDVLVGSNITAGSQGNLVDVKAGQSNTFDVTYGAISEDTFNLVVSGRQNPTNIPPSSIPNSGDSSNVNTDGNESTTPPIHQSDTIPLVPTQPTVHVSGQYSSYEASLSWSPTAGATYYKVYRNEQSLWQGKATTYKDMGLSGAYRDYSVAACNPIGCSNVSASIRANRPYQSPPQGTITPNAGDTTTTFLYKVTGLTPLSEVRVLLKQDGNSLLDIKRTSTVEGEFSYEVYGGSTELFRNALGGHNFTLEVEDTHTALRSNTTSFIRYSSTSQSISTNLVTVTGKFAYIYPNGHSTIVNGERVYGTFRVPDSVAFQRQISDSELGGAPTSDLDRYRKATDYAHGTNYYIMPTYADIGGFRGLLFFYKSNIEFRDVDISVLGADPRTSSIQQMMAACANYAWANGFAGAWTNGHFLQDRNVTGVFLIKNNAVVHKDVLLRELQRSERDYESFLSLSLDLQVWNINH